MKKILVMAAAVALFTGLTTMPAAAADLDRMQTGPNPDGSRIVVINTKSGGIFAPGQAGQIILICRPNAPCEVLNVSVASGPGALEGVTGQLVRSVGLAEAAGRFKPPADQSSIYAGASNYAPVATSSSSNATQGQGQCAGGLLCGIDASPNGSAGSTSGTDSFNYTDYGDW